MPTWSVRESQLWKLKTGDPARWILVARGPAGWQDGPLQGRAPAACTGPARLGELAGAGHLGNWTPETQARPSQPAFLPEDLCLFRQAALAGLGTLRRRWGWAGLAGDRSHTGQARCDGSQARADSFVIGWAADPGHWY